MSETSEPQRLAIRVDHWIEHNAAHREEFQRAAKTAEQLGLSAVSEALETAAGQLDQAEASLRKAADTLRQG